MSKYVCLFFLAVIPYLQAADVGYYGMIKSISYTQAPPSNPTILSSNGYLFNAFVIASTNGVVTNATLRLSNQSTNKVLLADSNGLSWRYENAFNSQGALDGAYPAGSFLSGIISYTFTIDTINDGTRTSTLDFFLAGVLALSWPPTPQITNLPEGRNIDSTRDFTLSWIPISGGSALDIVQVTVLDLASNVVFNSPLPLASNALNGTSTSILIPANTLPAGTNLQAHLSIAKPDLPKTNYAVGISALAKDTVFELVTRPAPTVPNLSISGKPPGPLQIEFMAEAEQLYHLQASTTLTNWTDLLVTNPPAGPVVYTEANPIASPKRFFRVQAGP